MSSTFPPGPDRRRMLRWAAGAVLVVLALAGCSTSSNPNGSSASSTVINVVAAENFWGSLAEQLGGSHVKVTSLINSPDADPHDYEPTAADGRAIATAKLVIINGVGYDAWATKLANANPSSARTTLTVGDLVGAKDGDNPHRWYNPEDVKKVIDQITANYKKIDPADAEFFDTQRTTVLSTNLKTYFDTVSQIKASYSMSPFNGAGPGLDLAGNGRGCNTLTGSFTVLDAAYGPNGYVQTFDATFEQHCEGGDPAARGEVHIPNPAPPPTLTLALGVATDGTASTLNGNATVHGTVTCNKPVSVTVTGAVTEIVKKVLVRGTFSTTVACTPAAPAPWTGTATPTGATPFQKGDAEVAGQAQGYDSDYGGYVYANTTATVTLRRG